MSVSKLIGLLMILGTVNGIVISLDVEEYLKELTDRFYRNESHAQLFDNVIQPPLFSRFLPDIFLWSPVKQLNIQLLCPIHGIPLQESVWTTSSRKNSNQNPRLIYGLQRNILLIQQVYVCPSGKPHRYYSASQFVMQHPKVKNLTLRFPFKKYHRSMYTVDLIEYIITQIINGVNFLPATESISAMHFSRYVKDTGDINVANFSNNTILLSKSRWN